VLLRVLAPITPEERLIKGIYKAPVRELVVKRKRYIEFL
jgi:hypothetical protein